MAGMSAVGLDFPRNLFSRRSRSQTDRDWRSGHNHLVDHHIVTLHIPGLGTSLYVDYSIDTQHSVADTFGLHSMDLSNMDAYQIAGGGVENVWKGLALVEHW